jgi:surfeit locus 1 family protein
MSRAKFTRTLAFDDMIFLGRAFKPTWWSLALTIVAVALFVALGLWQLDRADYKNSIKTRYEQRLAAEYLNFEAKNSLDDIEFSKVLVRGKYDNKHNFLVDNKLYQGKAGYHVLTPLALDNSDLLVLVNRGWVNLGASRSQLPAIHPLAIDDQIAGTISVPDLKGYRLGSVELGNTWPQVIPFIDIEALQQQFSNRLLPFIIWLAPEQSGHYIRAWNPLWADPEKSRAYATQWFSFAVIACLLFIIMNLRKIE